MIKLPLNEAAIEEIWLTGTLARVLATERKNHAAMTAPVGRNIRDRLEPMRDSVVELILVLVLR